MPMRKGKVQSRCIQFALLLVAGLMAAGCADHAKDVDSAETLYRQARAIEERTASDQHEAQTHLQAARDLYVEALHQNPSPGLEAYIRAGLANVSFFMDDYAMAIEQWTTAYPHLHDPDIKAWALYRVGLSQQRMGHFEQADGTFARVKADFPNSVPAKRTQEKVGVRQFYLQLGVYNNPAAATEAIGDLRKQGLAASTAPDAQGRHLLRVGPIATYTEARVLRARLGEHYPDALIVP